MGFWSIGSAVVGAVGAWQQNKNVYKQLRAQQQENQKNREYNLNLAKLQNEWNIQQWKNENAYNSPAAQMERMRQAGLNPDMMYGGGVSGNLSASSPTLTSGAPSSPMDWSALGSKKTIGSAIMDSLAIEQARANVRKTNAEAGGQEISNDFAPLEKALGIELTESQINLNKAELTRINSDVERLQAITLNLTQDTANKALEYVFKSKSMEHEIRVLANKAKMSDAEVEYTMKTLMARISYQDALNDKAEAEANEAKYKADIVKWQADTVLWNEFLKVWDKGIKTFETYLEFRGFMDETTEFFDRDSVGEVISKTTQKKHHR